MRFVRPAITVLALLPSLVGFSSAHQGNTSTVPVFRTPPRPVTIKPSRPPTVKPPPLPREHQEMVRKQQRLERERKAEEVKQEKAQAAEAQSRIKKERAEQKIRQREQQNIEQAEKAQAEKQAKIWSTPLTPEEATAQKRISDERQRYMDVKQKEARQDIDRAQPNGCVILPIMTDEQLARCKSP
jgi:cell division protein FtsN